MNKIQVTGQAISSTNYATNRLFNFNPDMIREAAENFVASGLTEMEIPEAVLDPEKRCPETGIDEATLKQTLAGLPAEMAVIGTYLGGGQLGKDNAAYLAATKRKLAHLTEHFPDMVYAMLHPAGPDFDSDDARKGIVDTWVELAEYADGLKPGFQLCLHNHYDSGCETADQVRAYLELIKAADKPNLRWGPDTGHCHGMCKAYLDVFADYASLIGAFFHIKARVEAFDGLHAGDAYAADRDIWGNKAEFGRGLYGGFVNCADPEIHTPFHQAFALIREHARSADGIVRGAMEIDVPRQHPRLEAMCAVLYLKTVHGVNPATELSCEEIVSRVFGPARKP
jgi:sugar phosphate isomerase/epimerase